MNLYRAINDVELEKLFEFYQSSGENYSFGKGMYFSYSYEFAKVFAQSRFVEKIGLIGEYKIELPDDTLSFEIQNKEFISCSHIEHEQIHTKYKEDPVGNWTALRNDYENYSAINHIGREVCLKKESPIELISISLILVNHSAVDLFNFIKDGEVVSEQEIKNISPKSISKIKEFLNNY